MSYQPPSLHRKSSAPWDRLRPVKQDPLESVGFVSKGDNRLLNIKTQETYYHKITARYMQFCAQHSKNLNNAFASLSLHDSALAPTDASRIPSPAVRMTNTRPTTPAYNAKQHTSSRPSVAYEPNVPDAAHELTMILTALRKLREGILGSSSTAPSPTFSQRVHVFNIRLAILALHPESYHASLRYLLHKLHSKAHPLPASELREMTSYLILDTALRVQDLNEAYSIRLRAKQTLAYHDRDINEILRAVVAKDWIAFWRLRNQVDGYMRSIMCWSLETLRKTTLKAIGRSYLKCDVDWVLKSSAGGDLTWEQLVEAEDIGWLRDGSVVIIRKPKILK